MPTKQLSLKLNMEGLRTSAKIVRVNSAKFPKPCPNVEAVAMLYLKWITLYCAILEFSHAAFLSSLKTFTGKTSGCSLCVREQSVLSHGGRMQCY